MTDEFLENDSDFLADVRDWIYEFSGLELADRQVRTYVEPDKLVDPTITLYTGTTESGIQTQDRTRPAVEYPHAQLIVRDRDVSKAMNMAKRLYRFMYETVPPYPYESIWPTGLPMRLGPPDGNARWPVGFAIRAQVTS